MVAGEASGDLLASHLIAALKRHLPRARFYGIGGPRMEAAGFDALFASEKLAVHGYAEALRHFFEILGIRRALRREVLARPPDAFIGVDAPDFNLALERCLRARGIPAIHYVGPSIWAWRGRRIGKIARSVSHMLVLFPFEPAIYERHGIPVTYVGHPLADLLPLEPDQNAVRELLGIPQDALVFALLPGSRRAELRYMATIFIEAARRLTAKFPGASFLVPLVTRETREMFELALAENGAGELPIKLMFGHSHEAMAAADGVVVASGTATLEAALLKKPMVIAYRMSPYSFALMRPMAYLPYGGLPNVLAGRFVVPEFIQDEATGDNLAQAMGNLICDATSRARLTGLFAEMHGTLRQDTADKAAAAILPYLSRGAYGPKRI